MTDPQAAMLTAAIPAAASALGLLIRSAAIIVRDSRIEITKRWEDSNAVIRDALRDSNVVIRENSQAFADLRQALGVVDARTQDVGARVVEIHQETSGVHDAAPSEGGAYEQDTPVEIPRAPTPTGRTPAKGLRVTPIAPIGGTPAIGGGPTQPRAQSSPYSFTKPRKDG